MKKIIVKIGRGIVRVGTGILRVFDSVEKADAAYHDLTPEAKEAALRTFADVVAFVVAAAAAAKTAGTIFTLDAAVVATVEKLYQDALIDVDSAKKVFAALGVGLTAPALPKAA